MKAILNTILCALFGVFLYVNISTLYEGHNWGDDFAQYIHHAINLVEHKPYTSDMPLDCQIIYPPGFPLLLSSVIYWFGINFRILKSINVLLWALSALAVYGLALNRLNLIWAGILTVWFLTFPFFFTLKQNVLSDVPFMSFVLFSLWSFMKSEEYKNKGSSDLGRAFLFLSIVCTSYALLIRWAGISLVLAAVVYFFVVERDWKKSLGFILGAFTAWFVALRCGSLISGYLNETTFYPQEWMGACWYNITYNFEMIFSFFITDDKLLSKMPIPISPDVVNIIFGLLLLSIIGFFIYRLSQRKISFMGCLTFFYLMEAFLWPYRSGSRYMMIIIVPLTIFGIKWLKPVLQKVAMSIFLVLIIQNLFVISSNFNFNDDDIYKKESIEMVLWVSRHIKPDEKYMFAKPQALWLLTHRVGASYGIYPENRVPWPKRVKPLHIDYLIADKHFDSFSLKDTFIIPVDNYKLQINKVWENSRYKIYKVS